MWKNYTNLGSLDQALEILADSKVTSKIIAGGTDLLLELEKSNREIDVILDISRIKGLDEINLDQEGFLHIGPLVTHNQCVNSKLLRELAFPLVMASFSVGSPQIRNRGTIAGNLVTGSPANDTISPLMALDAFVTLRSVRGERKISLRDFYTGVRKTVLQPDEILVDISFHKMEKNQTGVFQKYALRKAQAISLVNATCILTINNDTVNKAAITLGSVAPTIIHAVKAEEFLCGKSLTEDTIHEAAKIAASEVRPIDDIRSSAEYRLEMTRINVERGLLALRMGNVDQLIPQHPILLWGKTKNNYPDYEIQSKYFTEKDEIISSINQKEYRVQNASKKNLLRLIREDIGLTGTKEGCAEGECGACTILMDGIAVMSCLIPAPRADGAEITTVEGLSEENQMSRVQEAFMDEGAVQCGYCTPGFIMSSTQLLEEVDQPNNVDILTAISGNLCRCTGYYKIIKAIEKAAAAK